MERGPDVRRVLPVIVVVLLVFGPAARSAVAGPLRIRVDPNDSSSKLDIRGIETRLSATKVYLRLTSWDRFRSRDMHVVWGFALDTFGGGRVDRLVGIFPTGHGLKCDVRNAHRADELIGRRHATRPDRRSVACHLPRGWFGHIDRAVRFRAFINGATSQTEQDNAPDSGYYRWI
jgi:hypothetical protein